MAKLIHDVTPSREHTQRIDANYIQHVDTSLLATELFHRGVSITDLFGMYYALEEMYNHQSDEIFGNDEEGQHGRAVLTVGDVQLAGLAELPDKPINRQPF